MTKCTYSHGIYWAVDSQGNRISIENAQRHHSGYFCQLCHARLNPKKGNIRIHHFAHEKGKSCDQWAQPMSEWHKSFQELFPEEAREFIMEHDGEAHRADVFLKNTGTVIEFQHSPLSQRDFAIRNHFYTLERRNIIWLFDVSEPYKNNRIDIFTNNCDEFGEQLDSNNGELIWRWASKALNGVTAHDLDRQRVRVFLYLGPQSDNIPYPIAEVTSSDEGFKYCDIKLMSINDFVTLASDIKHYENAPINEFQRSFLNGHPADYAAQVKENHLSSLVVLKRKEESRLTAIVENNDDSIGLVLDHRNNLAKFYDIVDIVMDLRGWTNNRILISEAIGCKDYTGDFYRGRNNPYLVLKIKNEMRGYLELPSLISPLVNGEFDYPGKLRFRLWACVAFEKRVPTSLTWLPDNSSTKWCWPFVPQTGHYIARMTDFDGDSRFTFDARWTFPHESFLTDIARDKERYIKACKYNARLHEPPFVVDTSNYILQVFGVGA